MGFFIRPAGNMVDTYMNNVPCTPVAGQASEALLGSACRCQAQRSLESKARDQERRASASYPEERGVNYWPGGTLSDIGLVMTCGLGCRTGWDGFRWGGRVHASSTIAAVLQCCSPSLVGLSLPFPPALFYRIFFGDFGCIHREWFR